MKPNEYTNLSSVEGEHWYYRGKREIARYWIERSGNLMPTSLLVDCGAGTGVFAKEMQECCKVIAIDDHAEAISFLNSRIGAEHVRAGSCTQLPLESNCCHVVTALDVLEHIEDDYAAIREVFRVVKRGGIVVITVPAFPLLWCDWDDALQHFRRYTRRDMLALARSQQFEVLVLNYMNFWVFPAVWVLRRLRSLRAAHPISRPEDRLPPGPINTFLRLLFVWSSCQTTVRWPFGVGLLAVLRKSV